MLRTPPLALLLVATGCGARTPAPAPVLTAPASAAPASAAPATSALGGPAGGAPSLTALADARGLAVPGKVVPDDLTLTWSKKGGNLVNCRSHVRVDEMEGDKNLFALGSRDRSGKLAPKARTFCSCKQARRSKMDRSRCVTASIAGDAATAALGRRVAAELREDHEEAARHQAAWCASKRGDQKALGAPWPARVAE